ncbi:MAG: hypothetical protein JXA54_14680 [Candidatus Heimdallarchaeota archaeon]|nr:hypothetical protein [Candidatus Heimdallarchaeota archaeon]
MPDRKPPLINATYENILVFFALLTLVDMETIRTFTNLQTNYHIWSKFTNVLPFTREVLAIKLNHLSVEDFMSDFTEQIDEEQPYESNEQKTLLEMYADEFAIQISKAYIIPTLPQKAKCMISKIELNPSSDLLVCPYCVSFAKADLLANWLEIKKNCPICNRLLRIEDCPIVIIRSS